MYLTHDDTIDCISRRNMAVVENKRAMNAQIAEQMATFVRDGRSITVLPAFDQVQLPERKEPKPMYRGFKLDSSADGSRPPHRNCFTCKQQKPIDDFCRSAAEVSGYRHQCKACAREYAKKRADQARPRVLPDTPRTCRVCAETKPANSFTPDYSNVTGYSNRCRACRQEMERTQRRKSAAEQGRAA